MTDLNPAQLGETYPPQRGTKLAATSGTYVVTDELDGGAFGHTFLAEREQSPGTPVVIKLPKLDIQRYGWQATFDRQQDVNRSFHNEINALKQLSAVLGASRLLEAGATLFRLGGGLFLLPWLVYEYVPGPNLSEWMHYFVNEGGGYDLDAATWFTIASRLVDSLERIHQERVVHGDIWPRNIILRNANIEKHSLDPVFIDFGKGWLLDQSFEGVAENKTWLPYWAPERFELASLSSSPLTADQSGVTRWYAPADWYSLGITLLTLATGPHLTARDVPCPFTRCELVDASCESASDKKHMFTVMDSTHRSSTSIRDNVEGVIERFNPSLLRANAGIVDIIMSCIQPDVERRIHHAHELRQLIRAFDDRNPLADFEAVQECAKLIGLKVEAAGGTNSMFVGLIFNSLKSIESQLPGSPSRVFVQTGGREHLVASFVTFLSFLRKGHQLIALTTTNFWRDPNMGSRGRALSMLRIAAERGAAIRWVVCLTEDVPDHDGQAGKILRAQERVVTDFYKNHSMCALPAELQKDPGLPGLFFGVVRLSLTDFRALVNSRNISMLVRSGDDTILVAPDHSKRGGRLTALRFWHRPEREVDIRNTILRYLEMATPAYESKV